MESCSIQSEIMEESAFEVLNSTDQAAWCATILRDAKDNDMTLHVIQRIRTILNESENRNDLTVYKASKPNSSIKIAIVSCCLGDSFLSSLKTLIDSNVERIKSARVESIEQFILEEILRLVIEFIGHKMGYSRTLITIGFDRSALEIINLDVTKSLNSLSMTFLNQALDMYGSIVELNENVIRKVIDVIQTNPSHNCLRLECCEETCQTRMYSIHMGLCYKILSFKPQSMSNIHVKRLVLALCVCLTNAPYVEPMVIDLLDQVSRARESVFVATVIEHSFVPNIVSLLSNDNASSRPGVMKLINNLFAGGKHVWKMAQSPLLTYLPMILHKFDDVKSTLWALRLLSHIAAEGDDSADFFLDFGIATYIEFWLKSNRHDIVKEALTIMSHVLHDADDNDLIIHKLFVFDRYHIVACLVDIVEDHSRYRHVPRRRALKNIAADCLVEVIAQIIDTEYSELEKDNIWFAAAERLLENELWQSVEGDLALISGYNASLEELNDKITRLQEIVTLVY